MSDTGQLHQFNNESLGGFAGSGVELLELVEQDAVVAVPAPVADQGVLMPAVELAWLGRREPFAPLEFGPPFRRVGHAVSSSPTLEADGLEIRASRQFVAEIATLVNDCSENGNIFFHNALPPLRPSGGGLIDALSLPRQA
jgi:hypothetical protein